MSSRLSECNLLQWLDKHLVRFLVWLDLWWPGTISMSEKAVEMDRELVENGRLNRAAWLHLILGALIVTLCIAAYFTLFFVIADLIPPDPPLSLSPSSSVSPHETYISFYPIKG